MTKAWMLVLPLWLVGCGGGQDEAMMEEQSPAAEETAPLVEEAPASDVDDTMMVDTMIMDTLVVDSMVPDAEAAEGDSEPIS